MINFKKIDTISIKIKDGLQSIRINGRKVYPYCKNGAAFLAAQIEAIPVNHLDCFRPILVEFDEPYLISTQLIHLDGKVVSISVFDDNIIEAFVTLMDPDDITEMEGHDAFQTAMEQVVMNDKRLVLDRPVKNPISNAQKKKIQRLKDKSVKFNIPFSFSEIGYAQFTVILEAETFNKAFIVLDKVISNLEKKARKLMKKS